MLEENKAMMPTVKDIIKKHYKTAFSKFTIALMGILLFYYLPNINDIKDFLTILKKIFNSVYIDKIIVFVNTHEEFINKYILIFKIIFTGIFILFVLLFNIVTTYLKDISIGIKNIQKNFISLNYNNEEYIKALNKNLKNYDTWNENWHVVITLSNYNDTKFNNFFKCNIDYQYTKHGKINNSIIFCMPSSNNICKFSVNTIVENYENVWIIDEREFLKAGITVEEIRELYQVYNIIINNEVIRPEKIKEKNKIEYNFNCENKNINQISYSLTFPIEKNDILQLSTDYPTKNISITFNYDNIANKIIPYGYESLSFVNNILLEENHKQNTLICSYNDWVSPRDSYVVAWWSA